MADQLPPSPSPTSKKPPLLEQRQTQAQGVQLLPLLMKYFRFAGLLLLVWVVGYFGFSATWVMIGLFFFVANEEYRKRKEAKRAFAQDTQTTTEKTAILARVDELPSWVRLCTLSNHGKGNTNVSNEESVQDELHSTYCNSTF